MLLDYRNPTGRPDTAVLSAVSWNINSQHALLPDCTINSQSAVAGVINEPEEEASYLLKAVWVQLGLVYYLYGHL